MNDLFGNPIDPRTLPVSERSLSVAEKKKRRKETKANGYAWKPGTGPQDEFCRTCAHACCRIMSKRYWKCALIKHRWTSGPGTDIRLKSPACKFWEAKKSHDETTT